MPDALPSGSIAGVPGEYDDSAANSAAGQNSDLHFDSASGSFSSSGTYKEGTITPTFSVGEVWAIKIRATLSTEPSSDIIVLELMDEGENYYIQKATIPQYGGNDAEINTIVDFPTASNDGSASSPSPDVRITVVGSDNANYFIDVVGKRLKKAADTNDRTYPSTTTETIDS